MNQYKWSIWIGTVVGVIGILVDEVIETREGVPMLSRSVGCLGEEVGHPDIENGISGTHRILLCLGQHRCRFVGKLCIDQDRGQT
ncbi:MAG: hypothetical protein ABGX49_01360, partial [Candidatus Poseidoniia archaeon]